MWNCKAIVHRFNRSWDVCRYVDDTFTFDPARKEAIWGDVMRWIKSKDPETTVLAGNLECASELPRGTCSMADHGCMGAWRVMFKAWVGQGR